MRELHRVPSVSVLMPVYNGEKYLQDAICSVLAQSFKDFEFIVVDDGSTDKTAVILEQYSKKDKRIILRRKAKNEGIVAALNTGLNLACGKYIARMDADDINLPERLEKQFLFMESHPEVGVSSANAIMIDGKGNFLSDIQMPQSHILIMWAFCFYDPIIHPAVMANRKLCVEAGGYRDLAKDQTEYFPEDYDLWLRLSDQTRFHNLSEMLLKLRKHGENITNTRVESLLRNSSRICGKYLQSVLRREIPQIYLEMIWGIANPPSLRGMPQFIETLYNRFVQLPEISPREKQLIQEDAAMRLMRMAVKHPFDPYSLPVLRQALKINPKFHAYLFEKLLRKASALREQA